MSQPSCSFTNTTHTVLMRIFTALKSASFFSPVLIAVYYLLLSSALALKLILSQKWRFYSFFTHEGKIWKLAFTVHCCLSCHFLSRTMQHCDSSTHQPRIRNCFYIQLEIRSKRTAGRLIFSCFRLLCLSNSEVPGWLILKTCKTLSFVPVTEDLASTKDTDTKRPTGSDWDHWDTCLMVLWHHLRQCELITLTVDEGDFI